MSGRHGPRTRTGCTTCRIRKIKCDEAKPDCNRCYIANVSCSWDRSVRINRNPTTKESKSNQITRSQSKIIFPQGGLTSPTVHSMTSLPSISVPWILNGFHIPCANSLSLSLRDRQCIEYFPSSTIVSYYMKSFKWSTLYYLFDKKASDDSVLMHLILALSSSEMHRFGIGNSLTSQSADPGLEHYCNALKKFTLLLEGALNTTYEMEIIMGAFFLFILYEMKFGSSKKSLETHIDGVCSVLDLCCRVSSQDGPSSGITLTNLSATSPFAFTSPCAQLLLWIAYIDSSGLRGISSPRIFGKLFYSSNPKFNLERLHRSARASNRKIFGELYPTNEVQDDLERYRALELIHADHTLRYKILHPSATMKDGSCSDNTGELLEEIRSIKERFDDLMEPRTLGSLAGHCLQITIQTGVAGYYADVLLYFRLLSSDPIPKDLRQEALSRIMDVTHRAYEEGLLNLTTLTFSLFIAGVESEDKDDQEWIRDRLRELKVAGMECAWASLKLEEIFQMRSITSIGKIDLRFYLQEAVRDIS